MRPAVLFFAAAALAAQVNELADPAAVRLLKGGFASAQGIASDWNGEVYFADGGAGVLWCIDRDSRFHKVMDAPQGVYGVAVSDWLNLAVTEPAGERVSAFTRRGKWMVTLSAGLAGVTLAYPREIVADDDGGVYFTNPVPPLKMRTPERQRDRGVLYVPFLGNNNVQLMPPDLLQASGLALSPDGKTLYIADAGRATVTACEIARPGRLERCREFAAFKLASKGEGIAATGMAADRRGNLWLAAPGGIQVFSPAAKLLATIQVPEPPTHLCFGGFDGRTLYISAGRSVYTLAAAVTAPPPSR